MDTGKNTVTCRIWILITSILLAHFAASLDIYAETNTEGDGIKTSSMKTPSYFKATLANTQDGKDIKMAQIMKEPLRYNRYSSELTKAYPKIIRGVAIKDRYVDIGQPKQYILHTKASQTMLNLNHQTSNNRTTKNNDQAPEASYIPLAEYDTNVHNLHHGNLLEVSELVQITMDDLVNLTGGIVVGNYPNYVLNESIIITPELYLYISPGTTVVHNTNKGKRPTLLIQGKLFADGDPTNIVTFTAPKNDLNDIGSDYWQMVRFDSGADPNSRLEYCVLENAKVALLSEGSNITIDRSEIRNCRQGIVVIEGKLNILNSEIHDNNEPELPGGGILVFGSAYVDITNCLIYNNQASRGGGIYISGIVSLTNTGIYDNIAAYIDDGSGWGGGIGVSEGEMRMDTCILARNRAIYGGGILNLNSSPEIIECEFASNIVVLAGGGMYNHPGSDPTLENCTFSKNIVTEGGGAGLYNEYSDPLLVNCCFVGNSAGYYTADLNELYNLDPPTIHRYVPFGRDGGAIYNELSNPILINCIFTANSAENVGGVMYNHGEVTSNITDWRYSEPVLINCTIIGNYAAWDGSIYNNPLVGLSRLINCIVWRNLGLRSERTTLIGLSPTIASYSGIEGGWWGIGNSAEEPKLTPDGHLIAGSIAIDSGDPNFILDPNIPFDIDSDSRVIGKRVDLGADEFVDTDHDLLPDWWELEYFSDSLIAQVDGDPDGDGLKNLDEYEIYSSNPSAQPIQVDMSAGPFWTIQEGMNIANDGDTVLVAPGVYGGPGNFELDYGNKSIIVRSNNGSTHTVIDCRGLSRVVNFETTRRASVALEGFTLRGNSVDIGAVVRAENCRFVLKDIVLEMSTSASGGKVLYSAFSNLDVDQLLLKNDELYSNELYTGRVQFSNVHLRGPLILETGRLDVITSWYYGSGSLNLKENALLKITGVPGAGPTIISTDVNGTGKIEIDAGQQLIIEGDAVVNLGAVSGQNPDPNTGRIIVEGSLIVQGNATLESTNVEVKILDVNTPNDIQYNNITLLEASTGFGGEFFVAENAKIKYNNIVSEGDRYLDLDPDPSSPIRPVITNNRITVIIKEGTLSSQGTLLELRARDYDCGWLYSVNPNCASGAYQVLANSNGFTEDPSENWVLEKLVLEENAKLNLTNRQGFEFHDFTDPNVVGWETAYVKELVMGPNSVLNTALQTLYYQTLILVDSNGIEIQRDPNDLSGILANGSRFEDVPLLGFSLGVIAMNDAHEFDVRVHKRIRDPGSNDDSREGSVEIMTGDSTIPVGSGGIMDMRTQAPEKQSSFSVAAKGAFARAGDEDITIEFEYMFLSDPQNEAELVVYLSDNPDVGKDLIEVARIKPPMSNRPGSIRSNKFGVFSGTFSRGKLNFTRGTYIELELRGTNVRCWIDNWDPQVKCLAICGDYNSDIFVDIYDYLTLLGDFGLSDPGGANKGCLDLIGDGHVDTDDIRAWNVPEILNKCPGESGIRVSTNRVIMDTTPRILVKDNQNNEDLASVYISGKPAIGDGYSVPDSDLYDVETWSKVNTSQSWNESDGRLVRDREGNIYQVNAKLGLIRPDGSVAIKPKVVEQNQNKVIFGFPDYDNGTGNEGVMLSDAVFDPENPSIVYVVPVVVYPQNGIDSYKAAAKLRCKGQDGDWELLKLYDPILQTSHIATADPNKIETRDFVNEPDIQHLSEIEIDSEGKTLYLLSSSISTSENAMVKNNWVLIYDEDKSNPKHIVSLNDPDFGDPNLLGPTAMIVSSFRKKLYLACSIESPNDLRDLKAKVYCFSINETAYNPIVFDGCIDINCPRPAICTTYPSMYDEKLGFITAITSMTENSNDGVIYLTGFTAPKLPDDKFISELLPQSLLSSPQLFTTPMFAAFSPELNVLVDTIDLTGAPIVLPLSIVWADVEGLGVVNHK